MAAQWFGHRGPGRAPSKRAIAEQNAYMQRRQENFRLAAQYLADALAEAPEVEKVVIIGSVAVPLAMEVPRFREFRRAGVKVLHECGDLDLAAWVSDPGSLQRLRKLVIEALKRLLSEKNIGVAHHQVEVFIMEPGTDRYLGRLCRFKSCPAEKPECRVSGCGDALFLQQHEDFALSADAVSPGRTLLLFDRSATEIARPPK